MKIRILSDLHLEFMSESEAIQFIASVPNDCDVLVLAGDIATCEGIRWALRRFAQRFANLVYVAGNHEFYGTSPTQFALELQHLPSNVYALELGMAHHWRTEPEGIRTQWVLGCTLWFPPPVRADKKHLSDFYAIRDFVPWVYERNRASVAWLSKNVQSGDIVVTHHLPAFGSVHPKYAGDAMNEFFVCDVEGIITRAQPALWVHGHTHESCDYRIGATRIVCNPYGYHGTEVNPRFDAGFCVEV